MEIDSTTPAPPASFFQIEEAPESSPAPVQDGTHWTAPDRLEQLYELQEKLEGELGHLHLARTKADNAAHLLRLFGPEETNAFVGRVFQEAFRLLGHPHEQMLPVLRIETEGRRPFIAFPQVQGIRLFDIIRRRRQLELEETLNLLPQLADLADHAASAGIETLRFHAQSILLVPDGGSAQSELVSEPLGNWPRTHLYIRSSLACWELGAWPPTFQPPRQDNPWPVALHDFGRLTYELLGGRRDAAGDAEHLPPLSRLDAESNAKLRAFLTGIAPDPVRPASSAIQQLTELIRKESGRRKGPRSGATYSGSSLKTPQP